MSVSRVNLDEIDPSMGAMRMLRDALGSEAVGLTVVDCEPGWEGPEHEHADRDHEEIYLLLEGAASVTVDGETVDLSPGDAVLIEPGATRQIHGGDVESRLVLAGANR
jgi:quercetin dioxygenase-like cupin family protein